mmetsp:Transcript_17981/g.31645  ORF Transcript_17981/g.31645 Transcript_17981/m.31645 type:complete len:238 (-) Transcript_17981:16-729(-)
MANYNAAQGFDNDDGSSWYYTHDNVFYSALGFKMDYGGHSSRFYNNLVYGKSCYGTGNFLNKNLADEFEGNTCIMEEGNTTTIKEVIMGHLFQCSLDGMVPAKNTYFTKTGNGTFVCEKEHLTLEAIQQEGYEIGSTMGVTPDAETIISWARDVLGQPSKRGEPNKNTKRKRKKVSVFLWTIVTIVVSGVLCYYLRDTIKNAWNNIHRSVCHSRASSSGLEPLLDHNIFETAERQVK